jgi:hypothetical protein
MPDYTLTAKQQEIWVSQIGQSARGTQKKIAQALARKHGAADSWRTRLSLFFHGKEVGLRAVFEHADRLKIVAEGLGRKPSDLRVWLQRALGVPLADGPFDVRVPGFEDLGALPVQDGFYSPPQRETRFHLPSTGNVSSSAGGLVDLDKLVGAVVSAAGNTPRAIVVMGSPGQGRTPLMKAIGARFADLDFEPAPWVPGGVDEGGVVLADDLDLLAPASRKRMLAEVSEARATLLATTGERDGMVDLPEERVVCALREGDETWARGYLEHLQGLLVSRWSRQVDLSPLIAWIRDDPYALGLGARADTLGFLARHVVEGGTVPVRHRDFLTVALKRWAGLLRAQDQGAEALALELTGPRVFARAAAIACTAGVVRISIAEFCGLFVENLAGVAGDAGGLWAETAPLGMVRVVEALVGVGLLHREGDYVRPAQEAFFVAALGRELASRLDDQELVRAVVLDQRWHPAFVAAAEELRDPSPVLSAIAALPLATLCLSIPAVTRLLTAAPRPSDPEAFNEAFRRCLWWWLHRKADSRAVTMTLGGPSCPDAPPPPDALIGGVAPLVALGMVSRIHKDALAPLEDAGPGEDAWGRALVAYLQLLGRPPIDEYTVPVGLVLAAPYQSERILDPANWANLPGANQMGNELPGGVTRDEFALWWRTVAAPRLRADKHGDGMIAGTAPGWSLTWAMTQVGSGVEVWADALARRIRADDPESPRAFAEAVVFMLQWGGTANLHGVQRVWESVTSARRRGAIRNVVQRAIPRPPERWLVTREIVTWVLTELVNDTVRSEIWRAWTGSPGQQRYIPWESFLSAGLDEKEAAEWALASLPEHARAKGPSAERLESTGGGMVVQFFEAADSPQAQVLDHLATSRKLETLKLLLRAPGEWATTAVQRLQAEHPVAWRQMLLEQAAASSGEERRDILCQLVPQPGEKEVWEQIAATSENWTERLVRFCQVSLARGPGAGRWGETMAALHVLECVQLGGDAGLAEFARMVSGYSDDEADTSRDEAEEVPDAAEDFAKATEELIASFDQVLATIGDLLGLARQDEDVTELRDLIRAVFDSEALRPRILGGFHQSWWVLAWELLGKDFVVDKLVEGHADRADGEATRWRLGAITRGGMFDVLVLPLAQHEVLGDAAVSVVAARIVGTRPDLMLAALAGRPLVAGNVPAPPTVALARRLAQADPEGAVGWLRTRAGDLSPSLARSWWAILASAMPVGRGRDTALSEWLELAPISEAAVAAPATSV